MSIRQSSVWLQTNRKLNYFIVEDKDILLLETVNVSIWSLVILLQKRLIT